MKFLGIDYGSKRIGLAISDEGHTFAFPKKVINNDINTIDEIGKILKENKVLEIVVGESVDSNGEPNPIMDDIENFIQELGKKFSLPIHKQKEFFTSVEARGRSGKEINNSRQIAKKENNRVDASAAALILQRYLDKRNNPQI